MSESKNMSLLVRQPGGDTVMLVIAVVLNPETLDVERLLSGLVPEMARGGVRGGLLVIGDSTLVLRGKDEEIAVDEVDTAALLALAGIEERWRRESIVGLLQQWVVKLATNWRDRIVDARLRGLLVPYVVAGLAGDVEVVEGIWGSEAHRLVEAEQ